MNVIDGYLSKIDPSKRKALDRIRKIAKEVVPDAEDTISYGMPTLKVHGHSFFGFNLHKNHIGIYSYGGEEIELFKNELTELGYGFSSGAIRVPFDKEFPKDLLKKIIQHRIKRIPQK